MPRDLCNLDFSSTKEEVLSIQPFNSPKIPSYILLMDVCKYQSKVPSDNVVVSRKQMDLRLSSQTPQAPPVFNP